MIAAFKARRSPYAYLAFEKESHGFHDAASITKAIESELYFYSRIFGITLADPVQPITIHNLSGNDCSPGQHKDKAEMKASAIAGSVRPISSFEFTASSHQDLAA